MFAPIFILLLICIVGAYLMNKNIISKNLFMILLTTLLSTILFAKLIVRNLPVEDMNFVADHLDPYVNKIIVIILSLLFTAYITPVEIEF